MPGLFGKNIFYEREAIEILSRMSSQENKTRIRRGKEKDKRRTSNALLGGTSNIETRRRTNDSGNKIRRVGGRGDHPTYG